MLRYRCLQDFIKSYAGLSRLKTQLQHRSRHNTASSGVPYEHTIKDDATDSASSLPSSADVIVIGGGAIGCSTLYHLAKLGVSNALLLEKDDLTAGTTWHTAGLLWQLRPNDIEIQLLGYSRRMMSDLEEESGLATGWIQNGGLFIASNKQRLDEYKRLATIGKVYNIESHVLSPEDTKKIYPLMNVDDLYGTLYVPGDGTIDPAGLCSSLTRVAKKTGPNVMTHCKVTGIDVRADHMGVRRVKGVVTDRGSIACNAVVNCTGAWARYVGGMAGVNVPLIAMKHAYVVTERIEGIKNMPNVRDHDASVYLRLQGDALSVGGYEPNPIILDKGVDQNFAFSLYELDWDVFGQHITGATNRVPAIEHTGIKSTVCGPESFTPDHKPLMGEAVEVRGFFHGCGFNSAGMMLSGGCGNQLAHWVVRGRPEMDMFSYDIRRYSAGLTSNEKWIRERSHEAYAKNYSIVFKHDEPLAGRNVITSPLHEELTKAGCVFEERQGFERAGWFSPDGPAPVLPYDYYGSYDVPLNTNNTYFHKRLKQDYTFDFPHQHHQIGEECHKCRNNVVIFDMSYFGKFYISGPDSQKAVNWIFTNDVHKPPGSTLYTCMLNHQGGVEADLTVSVIEPGLGGPHDPHFTEPAGFYVAAGGGSSQHSYAHIQSVIQDLQFDVKLADVSDEMGMMSIQGPHSRDVLQSLTDTDLSNESFPFSTNQVIRCAGESVRALRLSFVGELGWELHVPSEKCAKVYAAIMREGQRYGISNAGYRAIDSLSLEKGYRHWHADLRFDDTPIEAGLAFTCKLKTDVPFLGRDALEERKKRGLFKRIACFTVDEDVAMHGLEAIWRNGEQAGFLRRADFAYTIGKTMGYGYVTNHGEKLNLDFVKSGEYEIERMGERYPATVHIKSPFDPDNERVQGIY